MATRYLTTAEAGEMLRTPVETLRYWRHVGRGPVSFRPKGVRRVLYDINDIEIWIAEARARATQRQCASPATVVAEVGGDA